MYFIDKSNSSVNIILSIYFGDSEYIAKRVPYIINPCRTPYLRGNLV